MGERFLFRMRKMDLVAEGRVDGGQGESPKEGERSEGSCGGLAFKPLPPLSEWLTVGKTRRQVRKAS